MPSASRRPGSAERDSSFDIDDPRRLVTAGPMPSSLACKIALPSAPWLQNWRRRGRVDDWSPPPMLALLSRRRADCSRGPSHASCARKRNKARSSLGTSNTTSEARLSMNLGAGSGRTPCNVDTWSDGRLGYATPRLDHSPRSIATSRTRPPGTCASGPSTRFRRGPAGRPQPLAHHHAVESASDDVQPFCSEPLGLDPHETESLICPEDVSGNPGLPPAIGSSQPASPAGLLPTSRFNRRRHHHRYVYDPTRSPERGG